MLVHHPIGCFLPIYASGITAHRPVLCTRACTPPHSAPLAVPDPKLPGAPRCSIADRTVHGVHPSLTPSATLPCYPRTVATFRLKLVPETHDDVLASDQWDPAPRARFGMHTSAADLVPMTCVVSNHVIISLHFADARIFGQDSNPSLQHMLRYANLPTVLLVSSAREKRP